MFEITPEDIAHLSDEQLRTVVARLCEAEVEREGLSTVAVTWGGNQNAPDGGIDVQVELPEDANITGYLPRRLIGFQVKAQDMPRREILGEMKRGGALRDSIVRLAEAGGAYIIVSSKGSVSASSLKTRRRAMCDAIRGDSNSDLLILDFYDRTRVASWVRSHQSIVLLVRELIGRPFRGWCPWGNWAFTPNPDDSYLIDDDCRVLTSKEMSGNRLSTLQALHKIRDQLRQERTVVRILGLSGVGKTRFVQGLFDPRIGENSLDKSLAFYTNISDDPDPPPIHVSTEQIARQTRGILVIDNCAGELHNRLSEICRKSGSKLSLVTIEFDIRDDEPEGTDVYTLEPSSLNVIERLILRRFPIVSALDAQTVAEFSGGNARVAISLASTVERDGTISGLSDNQLLVRLFHQRHEPSESLYRSAQVLSLVYSFEGEDISQADDAELLRLGRIASKTPGELYEAISELRARGLIQQRSVWRAVLPQAIADRLAIKALCRLHPSQIKEHLLKSTTDRLTRSFCHRLGYLAGSSNAKSLVEGLLGSDGPLGKVNLLDEHGRTMFSYIAPVAPEMALAALERAVLGGENDAVIGARTFISVILSMAYEKACFGRCVKLLVIIAAAENRKDDSPSKQALKRLFQARYSGTHASIEQRSGIVYELLASSDPSHSALGVVALGAMLKTFGFETYHLFSGFGSLSRDYGYWPETMEDCERWYDSGLDLVNIFALSDSAVAIAVRKVLASELPNLWLIAGVNKKLRDICHLISKEWFWPEGWAASLQMLRRPDIYSTNKWKEKVSELEAALRPKGLLEEVRAYVLSPRAGGLEIGEFGDQTAEDLEKRISQLDTRARDLGKLMAADMECLKKILPEVFTSFGRSRQFGEGLSDASHDPEDMWQFLVSEFSSVAEESRDSSLLEGFVRGTYFRDPQMATIFLDRAIADDDLHPLYPSLQVSVPIRKADVDRLKRSIRAGRIRAQRYRPLGPGRVSDSIPPADLKQILSMLSKEPSGFKVAVEILSLRLHPYLERGVDLSVDLLEAGIDLMETLTFEDRDQMEDYWLARIVECCLPLQGGAKVVRDVCDRLKKAVCERRTHPVYHDDLVFSLARTQPTAFLDGMCAGTSEDFAEGIQLLDSVSQRKQICTAIPDHQLLSWCDQKAATRYPGIARIAPLFGTRTNIEPPPWTSIAKSLVQKAPEPAKVVEQFVWQVRYRSNAGSSLESLLSAIDGLADLSPTITRVLKDQKKTIKGLIENRNAANILYQRQLYETFES